jgi:hypothetical protein
MSMVSTWELTVVVSADTTDLVRFPLLFFTSAIWVAAWGQESCLPSAVCAAVRRPWTAPYATWREPRCHSPPLSRCDNPPRKIPYYRLRPIHFGH